MDMYFGPGEEAELLAAFVRLEKAGLLSDVSADVWDNLPDSFCRDHELDRGRFVTRESGTPGHQSASLRLAIALDSAAKRSMQSEDGRCVRVAQDLDVRLWEVPGATVRRPDVLVYTCLDRGQRLWATSVLLAVEIVSPSSEADDAGLDDFRTGFESKKTQYARAGIRNYWTVWLSKDDSAVEKVEEWRRIGDLVTYRCVSEGVNDRDEYAIDSSQPFEIRIPFSDLAF